MKLKKLLKQTPRLLDWYNTGPVQRAELEQFAQALLDIKVTAITADGVLVEPGDQVWVFSSTGKPTSTTVRKTQAVTDYYLFGNVPVQHSFSGKQAALDYHKHSI